LTYHKEVFRSLKDTTADCSMRDVSAGIELTAYFVGAFSPLGHCTSSHTGSLGASPCTCRSAVCTRTAAKREAYSPLLPSCQLTFFHCSLGNWLTSTSMAHGSVPSAT
jgi:hypothetical protein